MSTDAPPSRRTRPASASVRGVGAPGHVRRGSARWGRRVRRAPALTLASCGTGAAAAAGRRRTPVTFDDRRSVNWWAQGWTLRIL
jgi:hypothetical protein